MWWFLSLAGTMSLNCVVIVCDERVYDGDEYAVGCDKQACLRWYHRHCLEPHDQATSYMSIMTKTDWLCPERFCAVCMMKEYVWGEDEYKWIKCINCNCNYHVCHFERDYNVKMSIDVLRRDKRV